MPMQTLRGKVAIVTGASSGIGKATAVALARRGAQVVLAARRVAELEQVEREIRALGVETLVVPTDVSRQSEVEQLVESAVCTFGHVDIVIANAGLYIRGPIAALTAADFRRSMEVNYFGAVHLVLAALPHLLAQRSGHIVLMSSIDGKKGIRTDAPYASSKFALAGFGDVLRQDLHGTGIEVSMVFPGRVATQLIEGMKIPAISSPIPPADVAKAVMRAIDRRQAEVVIPARARALLVLSWLSPRLGDWAVRAFHLEGLE